MKNKGEKRGIPRRDAIKVLGGIPGALAIPSAEASSVHRSDAQAAAAAQTGYVPKFFTEHEWKTAIALADTIIPADDRSGGAGESGAVEYIDEYAAFRGEELQTQLRGGLTWLDQECVRRFGRNFLDCSGEERAQVLDRIAHPENPAPGYSHATAFFSLFRDLTAGGFYTTRAGIADLGYIGNRPHPWTGCPEEVIEKLGLRSGR